MDQLRRAALARIKDILSYGRAPDGRTVNFYQYPCSYAAWHDNN
jgi:hypothetical protein